MYVTSTVICVSIVAHRWSQLKSYPRHLFVMALLVRQNMAYHLRELRYVFNLNTCPSSSKIILYQENMTARGGVKCHSVTDVLKPCLKKGSLIPVSNVDNVHVHVAIAQFI